MFGPTRPFSELDGLLDPTCHGFGLSNSPIWRVGRLSRSNSPIWRVGLTQLAKWVSWTACSIQSSSLVGWTLVFRCPGSVVRGLVQPSLKAYLVNPFRTCYETWFSSSVSLFFWEWSFFFEEEEDVSREVSDFDFVVTDFDPNNTPSKIQQEINKLIGQNTRA